MSTRSQICFQVRWKNEKGKEHKERRTVYRHSDGYPEGVLPDLREFLRWNRGRNTDVEYMAANFIYWSKRMQEELYWKPKGTVGKEEWATDKERSKWSDCGSTGCSTLHTGFGVCNNDEFHGDIEYYYIVDVLMKDQKTKITINAYDTWSKTMKDIKPIETVDVELDEE
jgi:hypothetical protein